jgi:acetyl esterase/lipase
MKSQILLLAFILLSFISYSQDNKLVVLWPGKVPGETKEKRGPVSAPPRNDGVLRYSEVTDPVMEVCLTERSVKNKAGVIICPGGAYKMLAYNKEGTEIAAWLNSLGYSAFVLQYRVPDKQAGALQDVQRAIRIIKKNASEWNLDPERIGVMGFSAGGSLSARAGTLYDQRTYPPVDKTDSLSCRPAFTMLIYPAYLDMGENRSLSPELKLTKDTPPVFIFQTADDSYCNSSLVMTQALRDNKISVELHILPKGGHGYGLRAGNPAAETWPVLAGKWLDQILKNN